MLRKKVLSVGPNNATLLVEETASGCLKVLHRINMTSWRPQDVETAQQICRVLSQTPIPVMADVENVVLQNAFLNIVVPYFPMGDLATHVRATPTRPPTDAQIAKWIHVAALATQTLHRRGFVHAALRLDKMYLSDDRGAAGVVVGIPQPLPLYMEGLAEARKRIANSSIAANGGGEKATARSNLSVTNMSVNSLELNFPPEVLQHVDDDDVDDKGAAAAAARGSHYYDARSDVWHLGAMMMALAAAHQQLPNRTTAIQTLVNEMCDDDPAQRPSVDEVLAKLQALHDVQQQQPVSSPYRAAPSNDSIIEVHDDVVPRAQHRVDATAPPLQPAPLNTSPSPEPVDPRPAAARRRTPPLVVPVAAAAEEMRAAQGGSSPVGMVLTPRGHRNHPQHQRKSATPTSTRTTGGGAQRAGRSVLPTHYHQPQRRQGTPSGTTLRAHSRPVGYASGMASNQATTTAARATHLASTAYLTQAMEAEQAEAQRRRDEAAREHARRRDQTEKERQAADEVHRQHQGNLRRIRQVHPQHHRDDIRRSIKQWQQQQQPLQEGGEIKQANVVSLADGIAIFATSDAPPEPTTTSAASHCSAGRGQTMSSRGRGRSAAVHQDGDDMYDDTDSITSPVSPLHRQHTGSGVVPSDSNDAGSSNEEREDGDDDQRGDAGQQGSYTPGPKPRHRRRDGGTDDTAPVVFEITPPRRRKPHPHTAGAASAAPATAALGGRAPFSHVARHDDGDDAVSPSAARHKAQQQQPSAHHPDVQQQQRQRHHQQKLGDAELSSRQRVHHHHHYDPSHPSVASAAVQPLSAIPSANLNVMGSTSPLSIDDVSRSVEGTAAAVAASGLDDDSFSAIKSRHTSLDSAASRKQELHVSSASYAEAGHQQTTVRSSIQATAGDRRHVAHTDDDETTPVAREGVASSTAVASIDVAAVAAMEWSGETLRHAILTGPWSRDALCGTCVDDVLRCVDAFVALPSVARLQPKANAQLFESVRRAVVGLEDDDDRTEVHSRRVGLFAVLAPLAMQLAAVEGVTALARELRTPLS